MKAPSFVKAAPKVAPPADARARAIALAEQLFVARQKAITIGAELAAAQELVNRIEQTDLPELMRELEMRKFQMMDGTEIEAIDDFHCGISIERKPDAHGWIRKQGDGGLIKVAVSTKFDRDEIEAAEEFAEGARRLTNHEVVLDESIHWQTLKSYLREKREKGLISGEALNALFGISPFSKIKITLPKVKKSKG